MPKSPSRRAPAPVVTPLETSWHDDAPADAFLFETAWEVCNQVGGIYQVVRSKVPLITARWRDRYCLIGPFIPGKSQLEIEEGPASGWLASALQAIERAGLPVHHGHWLIEGRPRVRLLEYGALAPHLPELRRIAREAHAIPAPEHDPLVDAALTFGEAVWRTLQTIEEELDRSRARWPVPQRVVPQRVRAVGLHTARVHGARHAGGLQRPRRFRPLRAGEHARSRASRPHGAAAPRPRLP